VLKQKGVKYLLLTGSTPVDVRQSLVDEFGEDDSIPVFLLSTKAGGMGLNLTVCPHHDNPDKFILMNYTFSRLPLS
jgi:SNF2 family DNA or RNA helicase